MNGVACHEPDCSEFVEVDPTGRYGRYNEILGKGASKTVYRAFDEYEGIEVAWNQVKLYDFLQSPEDLQRLYCEIHLLKTLKHKNIMKFYTSWVDTANRNINFVTELFTSGTLRQYRQKHKKVNIRAVKHWCRQILKGLIYLHSHDPPVIHRDLKCDNIFVNGHQGEVKIGDLGLAAILRKSHAAHCVGTPEFMAPEVYQEEYNELVDIYSFGMCVLEMVTFDYPYSECTHPAQIYKKVISGKKPDALYKVKDTEVRKFIEKCLATVSLRLSAKELLKDPFLQIDDCGSDLWPQKCGREFEYVTPSLREPLLGSHHSSGFLINGYSGGTSFNSDNGWDYQLVEIENSGIELFNCEDDEHSANVDISIKGRSGEDGSIFLRLRIVDDEDHVRNIYFPFDIEMDTALSVATEMVSELDMSDQDVTKIAGIIDREIASLVPEWTPGPGIEESPHLTSASFCHNCASDGSSGSSLTGYQSIKDANNMQLFQCSRHGSGAMHGRFEEIAYKVDETEHSGTGTPALVSSQSESDGIQYTDVWPQLNNLPSSSQGSQEGHLHEENEHLDQSILAKDEREINMDNQTSASERNYEHRTPSCRSSSKMNSSSYAFPDDYENDIKQELRWLKAKYNLELRELRDQQLAVLSKALSSSPCSSDTEQRSDYGFKRPLVSTPLRGEEKSFTSHNHFTSYFPAQPKKSFTKSNAAQHCKAAYESSSSELMVNANFYTGTLLPSSLHRTTSLPVDAVDV